VEVEGLRLEKVYKNTAARIPFLPSKRPVTAWGWALHEPGWSDRVYAYNQNVPHAVSSVTTEQEFDEYTYDANGNMVTRVEHGITWTQTYNFENRLATMSNGITTWLFSYDGDGTMVGQLITDGTTVTQTRFFMGGAYESTSDGTTETVRKYYAIAGQTFAMSDNGVMKYLLTDHLGSTVAVTDAAGTLLSETRYMPFGEPRADVGLLSGTDKTFTGQRDVPATGLMDYRARLYSSWLGRFIQPDSIVPGAGNPQSWNRYSYVLGNPIRYIDPSGYYVCDEILDGKCVKNGGSAAAIINDTIISVLKSFTNISISDEFTGSEKTNLADVLTKLRSVHGGQEEFEKDLGEFSIRKTSTNLLNALGYVSPWEKNVIYLDEQIFLQVNYRNYIAHEIGHVYDFHGNEYKSKSFVNAFSPNSCGSSGALGCIGLYAEGYQQVINGYRFLIGDFTHIYSPTGQLSRSYGQVSSIEDFADAYSVVTIGANNEFGKIDVYRRTIVNVWIMQ
jgi:RHS repeat-associated protein